MSKKDKKCCPKCKWEWRNCRCKVNPKEKSLKQICKAIENLNGKAARNKDGV